MAEEVGKPRYPLIGALCEICGSYSLPYPRFGYLKRFPHNRYRSMSQQQLPEELCPLGVTKADMQAGRIVDWPNWDDVYYLKDGVVFPRIGFCECMYTQSDIGEDVCRKCKGDIHACDCDLTHTFTCDEGRRRAARSCRAGKTYYYKRRFRPYPRIGREGG